MEDFSRPDEVIEAAHDFGSWEGPPVGDDAQRPVRGIGEIRRFDRAFRVFSVGQQPLRFVDG